MTGLRPTTMDPGKFTEGARSVGARMLHEPIG